MKLTIPFWKLPFQKLTWGRLFSRHGDWIILFELMTRNEKKQKYIGSREGWYRCEESGNSSVSEDSGFNDIQLWDYRDEQIEVHFINYLKNGFILDSERFKYTPGVVKKWFSSKGFEKKYWAEAVFGNNQYYGIMEEVRWHD